ncbi:unnamed protein product [Brachionus calyciflorus]|uniref:Uncharacterized protein n=1 Tax=Brachionus calyciflorus TaxID=104777 RepID=A0A813YSR1_9BILA|nr:unnamed protein product [Brachionus calyciflorus]
MKPNNDFKTNWNQLILLLWKNLRLQLKSPIGLILEILVPALFAFILLPIRTIVKSDLIDEPVIFDSFKVNELPNNFKIGWSLAYQPKNSDFINDLMKNVSNDLKLNLKAFDNEDEAVNFTLSTKLCLGVVSFIGLEPKDFSYKIRLSHSPKNNPLPNAFSRENDWRTNFLYPFFPVLGPREGNATEGGAPDGNRKFLAVQQFIFECITSK